MTNEINVRIAEALDSTGLLDAKIADELNVSKATISQWRNGLIRGLRADSAEKLEALTGYASKWIVSGTGEKFVSGGVIKSDSIQIPLLATSASMGTGEDHYILDSIGSISLKPTFVSENLNPITSVSNLRFIHAYGDSMEPTFFSGDILLIDAGIKTPDIDGIYVLEAHNRLFIKRVSQNMSGEFIITSDNSKIKTVDILNGGHEVTIHGRVLWSWNGKKH